MKYPIPLIFLFFIILQPYETLGKGGEKKDHKRKIQVSTPVELNKAVKNALPGDLILIEPGFYTTGFAAVNLKGTESNPIIIRGRDIKSPPILSGMGEGIKLSNIQYIKISNLKIMGFTSNGINIDDGGNPSLPSGFIVLENIDILDIGKTGNQDGVKLSGVENFILRGLNIEGWGGSGIDLVGCHGGLIENTILRGKKDFRNRNGVQIKGGSSGIIVQNSVFITTGTRCINIGGSTGRRYFRPYNADYEARNIIVSGNKFISGEAHIAWVTSINTKVSHNIFYLPEKFLARILQETKDRYFKPSQNGLFESNLVVTDQRVKEYINTGPGTLPNTFTFSSNAWFNFQSQDKPVLPTKEIKGIYNVYPDLQDFGKPEMEIGSKSRKLMGIGPRFHKKIKVDDFDMINIPQIKIPPPPKRGIGISGTVLAGIIIGLISLLTISFRALKKNK